MKRYVVFLETGYAGMDTCEALSMPDDHTEEELSQAAWDMAVDHASSHDIEASDCIETEEEYSGENVEGWAEPYDPEKHDMLRPGGGSFLEDFEYMEK
jgi:hypothetical protein